MPCTYILIGKVASGKTHYAEKLKADGVVPLSVDNLILTLFDGCLGDKHDEITYRASQYLFELAKKLNSMGISTSLDFGFWNPETRKQATDFFKKNNIKFKRIYFNPSNEIRLPRLDERNRKLQASIKREYIIGDELLARLDKKFITPSPDEYDEIISE